MFTLKSLVLLTTFTNSVISGQYGSRLALESSLANSAIDGRIAAIINGGKDAIDFLSPSKYGVKSGPIPVARYNIIDIPRQPDEVNNPVIEVGASDTPISIVFRTSSTRVNVEQRHTQVTPAEVESTRSEEQPHTVRHEVFRPVIQELREVIQPYRKYVQTVEPVIEEIKQIVSSGQAAPPLGQTDLYSTGSSIPTAKPINNLPSTPLYKYSAFPSKPTRQPLGQFSNYIGQTSGYNTYNTGQFAATTKPLSSLSTSHSMRQPLISTQTIGRKPIPNTYENFFAQKPKGVPKITFSLRPIITNSISDRQRDDIPLYKEEAVKPSMNGQKGGQTKVRKVLGGAMSGLSLDKRTGDRAVLKNNPRSPNDNYYLTYEVPVSFELADNRELKTNLALNSFQSHSKLYAIELGLNRPTQTSSAKSGYFVANELSD